MDDRVESVARVGIFENELAQPSAVDAAVTHVARPELADHGIEPRAARLIHGMRRLVGVDHHGTEVADLEELTELLHVRTVFRVKADKREKDDARRGF